LTAPKLRPAPTLKHLEALLELMKAP